MNDAREGVHVGDPNGVPIECDGAHGGEGREAPRLNADVVQKMSPGRSKIFRICSRPSGLAR
jgi:hypothetical protein